jgi:hypothetical protein
MRCKFRTLLLKQGQNFKKTKNESFKKTEKSPFFLSFVGLLKK